MSPEINNFANKLTFGETISPEVNYFANKQKYAPTT
jgi:hypothetical protein